MDRNLVGYQDIPNSIEFPENVVSDNLSPLFKLELQTVFGEHILDFNEDFLLSKENFDDIHEPELNNILNRLSSRRVILNSAISFGHQVILSYELQFKENISIAIVETRHLLEVRKFQQVADGKISKTSATVTNSEIDSYIYSRSEYKNQLFELKKNIDKLKQDIKFLEMFDKIIESRVMILLHLSKKRIGYEG